jgi:hypothetical protein
MNKLDPIKQTYTWKTYKRLLLRYRKAVEGMSWMGNRPVEEHYAIMQEMRNAQRQLDAFLMSHMFLRTMVSVRNRLIDTTTKQDIGRR